MKATTTKKENKRRRAGCRAELLPVELVIIMIEELLGCYS
jgi:hypothetical protein